MSRRPYHSPRRQAAARATREAVLEAARVEFVRSGYAGTTLAAIADAAGVSLATVKLVEPTKARLLMSTVLALIRTDDSRVPLVEQPWWRRLLAERDPERLLDRAAAEARAVLERQADLAEVIRQAAASDPEIAALEERESLGRWADVRQLAEAIAALGVLRADLDVDGATDTIWALASPQLFRLLVRRRGWSPQRWEAWLRDSLERQLLQP